MEQTLYVSGILLYKTLTWFFLASLQVAFFTHRTVKAMEELTWVFEKACLFFVSCSNQIYICFFSSTCIWFVLVLNPCVCECSYGRTIELILLIQILQHHYFGAYATASTVSIPLEQKPLWEKKNSFRKKPSSCD